MADLSVSLGKLRLRNPTMLASGILGISGSLLRRVAEAGAGAVVTKSLGLKERSGNPGPVVVDLGYGFLNAMGLPNPGLGAFAEEIKEAKKGGVPVIVSVFGEKPEEYGEAAKRAEEIGADGVELNVSCPHERVVEVCLSENLLRKAVSEARRATELPVFVKISPLVPDVRAVGRLVEREGADGIVATNTARGVAISVEARRPVLSSGVGGLSGKALKPISLRCVYELYGAVDIPIIGCGGIQSWRDAVEYLMAGASAIQIGTGVLRRGLGVFREVCEGISSYMEAEGISRVSELVGVAHGSE